MKELNFFSRMIRDILWKNKHFQYKLEILPDNPNPDRLQNNIVYVVGERKYIKWAYLKCPCGCNETIMLSLNKKGHPSWSVDQDKFGRASIYPSINRLEGCKSHFYVKRGKLIWF